MGRPGAPAEPDFWEPEWGSGGGGGQHASEEDQSSLNISVLEVLT